MRRYVLWGLMAAAVLLAGCPTEQEKLGTRKSQLGFRVQQYQECFYWKEFDRASLFVAPDKRQDFVAFAEKYRQGYTLNDFKVKDIQISPSGDQAAVIISRSYVLVNSVNLQSEEINQPWVRIKSEWFVAGPPY